MGVGLLHALHIPPYSNTRPQLAEGLRRLVHQLLGMSQEQGAATTVFGVHDRGHRFAGAGGVVQQSNRFAVVPHGLQRFQRLDLVLFQIEMGAVQLLAPLGREIVLDLLEVGMASEKHAKLVLDRVGLNLHLTHRPAIHVPPQVHHAVLLKEVVVEFILRHKPRIMGCLIVDFDGDASRSILQYKVRIATVLVDIVKMILRIQVLGFLRAEGITEQFNE